MSRTCPRRRSLLLAAALLLAGCVLAAGCPARRAPAPGPGRQPVEGPGGPVGRKDDVKDLAVGSVLEVPYILWGGDVATFVANGGETTQDGSIFHKQGLRLKLTRGDNFDEQVKNYKEGRSPFLRGTMSMLGQVSEDVGGDERTAPVVFLQLTWSAGDHLVARAPLKTLNDLKGKKIALQKGGPHVGMLNDVLHTAQFSWKDVTVVWTDDVTGDNGPAEVFRKDPALDACFAITPDMVGLTGGLESTGTGADKTVKDAHVLVSTAQMLRSIADVYACRKDYFDQHRDVIEKFTAGYLKATEELVAMKKESKAAATPAYRDVLALTQRMFGKDVASDADADGLISDAVFVGLPGNYSFFKDKGNLSGFDAKQNAALDLALSLGNARQRVPFRQADLDYGRIRSLGDLRAAVDARPAARFGADAKEINTIYSFEVHFEGGRADFPEAQYGRDFQRAVEQASLFGNALISVQGHANPQDLTWGFRKEVVSRGILKERQGKFYRKDGSEFDMNNMGQIIDLIHAEKLGDVRVPVTNDRPQTMQEILDLLQKLSEERAASVRRAVLDYAGHHGYRLDQSQMRSGGHGGTEPVLVFPKDYKDGGRNRRVVFSIVRVGAEAINAEDFDF